jgi:DNA-binding winged helix-turn-helix (wHTH) protein
MTAVVCNFDFGPYLKSQTKCHELASGRVPRIALIQLDKIGRHQGPWRLYVSINASHIRTAMSHGVRSVTRRPIWCLAELRSLGKNPDRRTRSSNSGVFSVFLRQRQLVADGVSVKLGTPGYDLLLALLEADGALVTKEELFRRVWPGIVVVDENLKMQMSALALGPDCDFIRTEFGRGYRFTAEVRFKVESRACCRSTRRRRHARRSVWTRGSRRRGRGRALRGQIRSA